MSRETPLLSAVEDDDIESVRKLLADGVDLEDRNAYGQTALHLAAGFGRVEIMALLLEHNADIEAVACYGHRPLMLAGSNRCFWKTDQASERTVASMLKFNPQLNAQDRYGWTALHHAAYDGHTRTVERLLFAGADRRVKNRKQEDPLTLAVKTPQRHPYEDRKTILPSRKEDDSLFDVVMVLYAAEGGRNLHWKRRASLFRLAEKYRCPEIAALFGQPLP
ncbi:MAG: ankyrin repeat domain-containing protein [Candidatus Aminicenantes bacterium]|nr:ankyrin repeat domain-containing protein [Candidatus Aminicenantes bacterium]